MIIQTNEKYWITGAVVLIASTLFISMTLFKKGKYLLKQTQKNKKHQVQLTKKEKLSPDTYKFTFSFNSNSTIGIDNGQHVKLHLKIGNEIISRNYTPTSPISQKGSFDLVVKIYRPNLHPQFPDGGKFTPHLEQLKIGSFIDVSGPVGRMHYDTYKAPGVISLDDGMGKRENKKYKNFLMIAGGTGITPMYQMIDAINRNLNDKTALDLIYVNRNEDDILLRQELEEKKSKQQLILNLGLTNPSDGWNQLKGRINKEIITNVFGKYQQQADESIVLLCGPHGFTEGAKECCKQQGFKNFYTF